MSLLNLRFSCGVGRRAGICYVWSRGEGLLFGVRTQHGMHQLCTTVSMLNEDWASAKQSKRGNIQILIIIQSISEPGFILRRGSREGDKHLHKYRYLINTKA